jgi:hypothetical protein
MFAFLVALKSPARLAVVVCLLSALTPISAAQIFHDPRRKTTVGFAVDLELPADQLEIIVEQVIDDRTIRGSKIYARDSVIEDATAASTSNAFNDSIGKGKVFYKIREGALAPVNFPGSNDIGVVTVRYIVEPLTPQKTRLRIDAIFIAERGLRCPSDGSVETAEYAEILALVKAKTSPHASAPSSVKPAAAGTAGLETTLAQERERLEETKAALQKLQQREKQLEFNTMGLVKSPGVPLKASPYMHASTVVVLDKAEKVSVVATTKYWYRIRREHGEEGWLYYVFLEPLPQ